MTVSIIIAVKTWQKNLEECVAKCQELDYPEFEIIILPDDAIPEIIPNKGTVSIKVIPTGAVNPSQKRDIAIDHAQGEILAFLDDDAYPSKGWLKNAIKDFTDQEVAAVGGPAITPEDDSLKEKASGEVYSSFLVSGPYSYRYQPKNKREVDDYPSCNFLVRKSVLQELGGFKTEFWPGEDTFLCLEITKKLKKKIIYDPGVLAYHHRRPLFIPHLKQIASYALHRGYFVKRFPQTSFRLSYFIPSLFLVFIIAGIFLSFLFPWIGFLYLLGLTAYFVAVAVFSINQNLRLMYFKFLGIIFTHLTYGVFFLKGLFSRRLKEEI